LNAVPFNFRATDGPCVRLQAKRPNHILSYDFVQDRLHDGRVFRRLNIIDAFTREALVIRVKRRLNINRWGRCVDRIFIQRGAPAFIRSDNGAEFIANKVRAWIGAIGAKTAFIVPIAIGETGIVTASSPTFAMSCSTARCSKRCANPRP
jgi:putative transposase